MFGGSWINHHVINPSRPSPTFRTASNKSWAWRPGNEAYSVARLASWTPPGMFTLGGGGGASSGVRASVDKAYCSEEEVKKKR